MLLSHIFKVNNIVYVFFIIPLNTPYWVKYGVLFLKPIFHTLFLFCWLTGQQYKILNWCFSLGFDLYLATGKENGNSFTLWRKRNGNSLSFWGYLYVWMESAFFMYNLSKICLKYANTFTTIKLAKNPICSSIKELHIEREGIKTLTFFMFFSEMCISIIGKPHN